MLHSLAYRHEKVQAFASRQVGLIAVVGDRDPFDEFHHEVRSARFRGPGVEHLGDVRVVHQGESLPLRLEPGNYFLGVHARLDNLQGDLASYRLKLLRHEHHTEPAFANLLQEFVPADHGARALGDGQVPRALQLGGVALQKVA